MMRRFSRRRRGGAGDAEINGESLFARMLDEGLLDLARLEVLPADAVEDVPTSYAAVGRGEDKNGTSVIVSFAPRSAGDALWMLPLRLREGHRGHLWRGRVCCCVDYIHICINVENRQ